ncbi:hypothetical protein KEM55_001962 [Ascosphaera atra]|nr:hypothetical protein KEM55_001962 [Ascosphaera atra]
MTKLRDGPAPSSSLPNATASSPLFTTASTTTATKGDIASHNDAQTLLTGFVFADLKSDIARNKHVAGNSAGTTTDTDATTDTTPGYEHGNDERDSTILRSLSNSSSRRCPAPPALNFDVSALSDIYEEEDVRSQDANANGNGNDAPTTPVPASAGGLQTPNFPDDVSTVYTNDDESEYASDLDIGRRAEKRLESAKRRLTCWHPSPTRVVGVSR